MEPLRKTCHNLSPVTDLIAQQDADLLTRARALWPDCAYLAQATIGRGMVWDAQQQRSVEREGVVVVEVKGEG